MRFRHGYNRVKEGEKKRELERWYPLNPEPVVKSTQDIRLETLRSVGYLHPDPTLDHHFIDCNESGIFDRLVESKLIKHEIIFDDVVGRRKLVSELIVGVKG